MKITKEWLKEQRACNDGYEWFIKQDEDDAVKVLQKLMMENRFNWANWTIVRLITHKQKTQYAVFAAEQILPIFEKKYPKDKRPREAIEAAKEWIKNPTEKNRAAANAAADAAYAAADAANAAADAANAAADAADAAYAAANAAYAAANAAYAAANAAAYAAANAAYAAANAAANAAYAAADAADRKEMQIKILDYGIDLLKGVA